MNERAGASASTGDELAVRRKRALYRAQYRGTKEMDWMIGRYAAAKLDAMPVDRLDVFETFLEVSDPQINAWLMAEVTCDVAAFETLIEDIRRFHALVEE